MHKTVLLIRNANSYDYGGGERVPVVIGTELVKNGYQPIIVSRSSKLLAYAKENGLAYVKGWWWQRQDWSGKRVIFVPIYLLWQVLLIFWYVGLIVKTRAAIVHPQSKDDFIAATVAAKVLGRKVIWSDYADLKYIYQNNKIWYKNPVGKIVKFLDRFASAVILTSQNDKRLIEHSLDEPLSDRYLVVHYGVLSGDIKPSSRPPDDKDSVIFVATSRLVTAKGIGELIEAFKTISADRPNVRLWLFGEGPEEDQFKKLAATNTQVVFWGYPNDTLARAASCDVFVHPSYLEGFSISLVEAAKLGLPIIACNVGGNPELVVDGHNGLLVKDRDVQSLADAMARLADDEVLRHKFGQAARKDYEAKLIFENIVKDQIIGIYEK
jgi:glycosyltransferase involved in cell wall biosynthesis